MYLPTEQQQETEYRCYSFETSLVSLSDHVNMTIKKSRVSSNTMRISGKMESVKFGGGYLMISPWCFLLPEPFSVHFRKLEFILNFVESNGTLTVEILKWQHNTPTLYFEGLSDKFNRTLNFNFAKNCPKISMDVKTCVIRELLKPCSI